MATMDEESFLYGNNDETNKESNKEEEQNRNETETKESVK